MKTTHDNHHFSYSEKIREFILKTGFPMAHAPDALAMTSAQFIRWWNTQNKSLIGYQNLLSISKYAGVTEGQILFGTFDFAQVREHIIGRAEEVPEEYSLNQFSHTRSSAHILKYISLTRGQHFADQVLRELHVSPLIYQNLDNKISLNYFLDLLEVLEKNGVAPKEIDLIAGSLFLSLADTPLGQSFAQAKTYYECYQVLAENLNLFDENFAYTSDLDSSQYRMSAFLPYQKHSHIHFTQDKLARLHRYRQILLGWFPYLSNQAPILPKVTYEYKLDGVIANYVVHFYGSRTKPLYLCSEPKDQR